MIKMKVNGIDVSEYKAELIDRAASTQVIKSITDWLDGSVQGTLLRQSYDYKSIRVTFIIKAENEDDGYKQISRLTEALKKCCVKFDDIDLMFPCLLNGASVPERLQNGVFRVSYILLNDWGIGDTVELEYEIPQTDLQELKIKYIENWAPTAKGYAKCYDDSELYKTIAEETVYIETEKIAESAAQSTSWVNFFLALGVDVDKYKPETNNTLNGFIDISEEYSEAGAVELMSKENRFNIYYNRFQKDGLADLPLDTVYPSLVWSVDTNEDGYYFDLGVGKDWNMRDITILAIGRWFEATGAGTMVGAGADSYSLALNMPNASYMLGSSTSPITAKVFTDSAKGNKVILQTLEDIDDTPLRKYGFKSSNDGAAPINGYADVIFNGVTLDRTQVLDDTLDSNITLLYGNQGKAKFCDMARIQIFYKGELIRDLIPIAGNVKNGFVNSYDTGLYDIISMEFIPWTKSNGDTGASPEEIMPIPGTTPTPQPPTPPTPIFTVVVNNGSGSGQYESGSYVSIEANEAPAMKEFSNWSVDTGNATIISPTLTSTGFIMPDADVTVTANYKDKAITPEIMYYSSVSQINSETEMGENKGVWASTQYNGDGPNPYEYFVAVYSVPSAHGEWSIYNSSYYSMDSQGTDKWGRPYIEFQVTRGKGITGQYITYTPSGGTKIQQNFAIKSV
jgi:hypothetical protein